MTEEAVRRALESAIREAFGLGVMSTRDRSRVETLKQQAQSYAADLVLPQALLLADEAREQGWVAAKRASDPSARVS